MLPVNVGPGRIRQCPSPRTQSRIWLIALLVSCGWLCPLAQAQVVQLPSYRQFQATGGMIIPDQGTALMAASGHQLQQSARFGPGFPNSRAMSSSTGTGLMSVSVQIIDLDALDKAILASAAVPGGVTADSTRRTTGSANDAARRFLAEYPTAAGQTQGIREFGNVQRALRGDSAVPPTDAGLAEANVRHYLKLAREAEQANRLQSARVYSRLAMEAMTPDLLQRYQQAVDQQQQAAQASAPRQPGGDRKQF